MIQRTDSSRVALDTNSKHRRRAARAGGGGADLPLSGRYGTRRAPKGALGGAAGRRWVAAAAA